MGNCPFFLSLSHNTASCIVTQGLTGPRRKAWARKGVQWHATTRRGKAGTRPCDTARKGPRHGRPARKSVWQRAHVRSLAGGGSRDTNIVSWLGGGLVL